LQNSMKSEIAIRHLSSEPSFFTNDFPFFLRILYNREAVNFKFEYSMQSMSPIYVIKTDIWKIRRLDPRISLSLPVVIEGKDSQNQIYRDDTFTENVSRMGACVVACREMNVGEQVTLYASSGPFKCHALVKIIWTDNTDKKLKAGLQFLEKPRNWVVN
jgi:hypothetical protein